MSNSTLIEPTANAKGLIQQDLVHRLNEIRRKIRKMVAERTAQNPEAVPSDYWTYYIGQFKHLLEDGDTAPFFSLREHTHVITGTRPKDHPGFDAKVRKTYETLRLPSWVFDVVQEPKALSGFGADIDGRLINFDIVRYLMAFSTLDQAGLLQPWSAPNTLEIGGGWGGFAHHFKRVFPKSTYVIIDLPETMIFSASYLTLLNPDAAIYIYDRDDVSGELTTEFLEKFDFVFLPTWKIGSLPPKFFDFALNLASLQEMTPAQVNEYMRQIIRTTSGFFYSQNKKNAANKEIDNVHEYIERYFQMVMYQTQASRTFPGKLRNAWRKIMRIHRNEMPALPGDHSWRNFIGYTSYLCTPREIR